MPLHIRIWFAIKTFIHLHINAYRIARHLDDCLRRIGQQDMDHPMRSDARNELISRQVHTLPQGWKWRND